MEMLASFNCHIINIIIILWEKKNKNTKNTWKSYVKHYNKIIINIKKKKQIIKKLLLLKKIDDEILVWIVLKKFKLKKKNSLLIYQKNIINLEKRINCNEKVFSSRYI